MKPCSTSSGMSCPSGTPVRVRSIPPIAVKNAGFAASSR